VLSSLCLFVATFWKNKVVMITGASSGIGKGLATELAARGAKIGLLARRQNLLDEIVNAVRLRGGKAFSIATDVRDADAMRAAAERIRAELGWEPAIGIDEGLRSLI